MFFALTVVTTIGYGHTSPQTSLGRVFFIAYALYGIPLMLAFLTRCGTLLANINKRVTRKLSPNSLPKHRRVIEFTLLLVVGFLACICIPSGIFWAAQGEWAYEESVYYAVSSLSTVGFGDYIPSK